MVRDGWGDRAVVITAIQKHIFAGSEKNQAAPYIFIVLCAYVLISTVYTLAFFDVVAMFTRAALGVVIILVFIIIELSGLGRSATAFLTPSTITALILLGAVLFNGDGLIFRRAEKLLRADLRLGFC